MTQPITFAGFSFPQEIPILPRAPLVKRLAEFKVNHGNRVCGPYFRTQPSVNAKGMSFYLGSDFMPDMRWEWCDEVEGSRVRHTGWFCDDFQDQKIRGLVFRLPHSRGFLAGWSLGEGMASGLEYEIYDYEIEASRAADSLAENIAEAERERNEYITCPKCDGVNSDECELCEGEGEVARWKVEEGQ